MAERRQPQSPELGDALYSDDVDEHQAEPQRPMPQPRVYGDAPSPPQRRGHRDYFGDIPGVRDPNLPQAGDPIWYRVRSDGLWVRAVVLDPSQEGLEDATGAKMLHLAVDLTSYNQTMTIDRKPDGEGGFYEEADPERRLSSSRLGYRLNVQEGTRPGEWQRERPANADAEYAASQAEQQSRYSVRREMAIHGSLQATHTGRLPRGVKA